MRILKQPLKTISSLAAGTCLAAIFGVMCFGVLNAAVLSSGTTSPAHSVPVPPQDAKAAAKPSQESSPMAIVPHRALYTMKLAGTRNGSRVSDISGRMLFSWADDCHAWNVEQKMQLRFFYSEGEVSDTVSDLISREAKDGSTFNFHTRHSEDGAEKTDVYRGYANLNLKDGTGSGEAVYSGDSEKRITLSNTLFPAHHTMQLLEHARKGDKFFNVNVFDGADEKGFSEISSFISSAIEAKPVIEKASSGKEDKLTSVKTWPIRMAFFAPNSETGSPEYEMDMVLLDNGIIKSMTIDYGEYSMTADLVEVKAISPAKCTAESLIPHS